MKYKVMNKVIFAIAIYLPLESFPFFGFSDQMVHLYSFLFKFLQKH